MPRAAIADGNLLRGEFEAAEYRAARGRLSAISSAENGEFDYIVAHGLYSWIPADVRDRLMALCRELLAPARGRVSELQHVAGKTRAEHASRDDAVSPARYSRSPRRRLREARRLLTAIDTDDAREMLARTDDVLFHDDLAPVNDPVWFRDFVAHAGRHGLQYLGEARRAARGSYPPRRSSTATSSACASFRQSLLCREEVTLDRRPDARDDAALSVLARDAGRRAVAVTAALPTLIRLPLPFEELLPYDADLAEHAIRALSGAAS